MSTYSALNRRDEKKEKNIGEGFRSSTGSIKHKYLVQSEMVGGKMLREAFLKNQTL